MPQDAAAALSIPVGLDIGGTKTLAVALEPGGAGVLAAVASRDEPTPVSLGKLVDHALDEAAGTAGTRPLPSSIGVGLAGWIDRGGVVRRSPHLPELVGVDPALWLGERFGVPAVLENDANCAAVAALASMGEQPRCLLAVTIGTGVGAGFVVDGELQRGAHGYAGEPGHMVLEPGGPPCPCGQSGCWERRASGPGLAGLAAEGVAGGRLETAEAVVAAARRGDDAAMAVIDEFAGWVARGLTALANMIDPDVIVLGGGLVAAADTWLPEVRRLFDANPTVGFRGISIDAIAGAERAGALGAALLAGDLATGGG